MTKRNVLEYFYEQYANNPNVDVQPIGEPITLKDGSELGLFDMKFLPTDRHEVRVVQVGEDGAGQWFIPEEEVIELGEGNFHVGVIKAAKNCVASNLL